MIYICFLPDFDLPIRFLSFFSLLDSTCKPYHVIFVFLCLIYFTLYDSLRMQLCCQKGKGQHYERAATYLARVEGPGLGDRAKQNVLA